MFYEIEYTVEGLKRFNKSVVSFKKKDRKYLLDYPTVYIINNEAIKNTYSVYIGETSDIKARANQHLIKNEINKELSELTNGHSASMFVIGHEYFNKS